jgi:uncharacterized cofD-like protein
MTDHIPSPNSNQPDPLVTAHAFRRRLWLSIAGALAIGLGGAFLLYALDAAGWLAGRMGGPQMAQIAFWLAGLLFLILGTAAALAAILRPARIIEPADVAPAMSPGDDPVSAPSPVAPEPASRAHPQLQPSSPHSPSGLRVVVIGGGTGMPQLLRGLRAYTDDITAVVTVADDGGSSGRLRRQMGLLPPGDFRNNIAALSDAEDLMMSVMQYRFADREGESELAGHSFGNLFIAAMAAVTGSFEAGIAESSRVLAVRGRVLPSTLEHVTLCAEVARAGEGGSEEWLTVKGESNIPEARGRVMRVFLEPDDAHAYPAVIQAILRADLIVAGPGSFFTSVMPNLLVASVCNAITAASAPRVYVCNIATQPGETDGYTVSDHMRQLRIHTGNAFTIALANDNYDPATIPYAGAQWVALPRPDEVIDYQLFHGDLRNETMPSHHDPDKLAAKLMAVYETLTA